ncbi:MAG: hypothetical protein GC160_01340 [Acidobacteria bacterium]|nr:hypothetical protein [Acidobacteriota bacterium]
MSTTMACLMSAGAAFWLAAFLCRFRSARLRTRPQYGSPDASRRVTAAFSRLLAGEELHYVRSFPGAPAGLSRRLKSNRQRVLGEYLQQLRVEHADASRNLRELAARMDRPDLAAEAVRRAVRFNAIYWSLRLQLASGIPVNQTTLAWVGFFRSAAKPQALEADGATAPAGVSA